MIIKNYNLPLFHLPSHMLPPQGCVQCSEYTFIEPSNVDRIEQNEIRVPDSDSLEARTMRSFIYKVPSITQDIMTLKKELAQNPDNKEASEKLAELTDKLEYYCDLYGAILNDDPRLRQGGELLTDETGKVMTVTQIIGRNDKILGTISPAFATPDRVVDAVEESKEADKIINLIG